MGTSALAITPVPSQPTKGLQQGVELASISTLQQQSCRNHEAVMYWVTTKRIPFPKSIYLVSISPPVPTIIFIIEGNKVLDGVIIWMDNHSTATDDRVLVGSHAVQNTSAAHLHVSSLG